MRYEEEVARGIAVLDKARPSWRDEIDLDGLLMSNPQHCVVGQVFAGEGLDGDEEGGAWASSYDYGIHELRNMSGETPVQTETNFAISHGFDTDWYVNTDDDEVKTDLEDLRDAWIAALTDNTDEEN